MFSSNGDAGFSGSAISYVRIRIAWRALSCSMGKRGGSRAGAQGHAFHSVCIVVGYGCGVNGFVSFLCAAKCAHQLNRKQSEKRHAFRRCRFLLRRRRLVQLLFGKQTHAFSLALPWCGKRIFFARGCRRLFRQPCPSALSYPLEWRKCKHCFLSDATHVQIVWTCTCQQKKWAKSSSKSMRQRDATFSHFGRPNVAFC